jgi:DNA-binding response OmpR family regulator
MIMTDGKRILIIDPDPSFRETLSEQLTALAGFQCEIAPDGEAGLEAALSQHVDLLLLSRELPGHGGHELCRQLREQGMMAPIVMLTADDSENAIISSLDAGATDCIVKPFKIGVLLARMRAHIRQFAHSDDAVLAIGPFAFRPGAKTLTGADEEAAQDSLRPAHPVRPVRLTDKEVQILKYLYMHAQDRAKNGGAHDVVGREELLGEVWGYNAAVTTHTLETHVYRLRQKMERDPAHAEILVTEPGGYRLNL